MCSPENSLRNTVSMENHDWIYNYQLFHYLPTLESSNTSSSDGQSINTDHRRNGRTFPMSVAALISMSQQAMQNDFVNSAQNRLIINMFLNQGYADSNQQVSTCQLNNPCNNLTQLFKSIDNILEKNLPHVIATNMTTNILFIVGLQSDIEEHSSEIQLSTPVNPNIRYYFLFQTVSDEQKVIKFDYILNTVPKSNILLERNDIQWILFNNLGLVNMKILTQLYTIHFGLPNCKLDRVFIQIINDGDSTTGTTKENFIVESSQVSESTFRVKGAFLVLFKSVSFIGEGGIMFDFKYCNQIVLESVVIFGTDVLFEADSSNFLFFNKGSYSKSDLSFSTISVTKIQMSGVDVSDCNVISSVFSFLLSTSCVIRYSTFKRSGVVILLRGFKQGVFQNLEFSQNTPRDQLFLYSPIMVLIGEEFSLINSKVDGHYASFIGHAVSIKDVLQIRVLSCEFSNNLLPALVVKNEMSAESTSFMVSIQNSTFLNNNCKESGCGLVTHMVFNLLLNQTTFRNNTSSGDGGAILAPQLLRSVISNCSFYDNSAENGGAIFLYDPLNDKLNKIIDCLFVGNKAVRGGAIYTWQGTSTEIISSTFISNKADYGAAIYSRLPVDQDFVRTCTFLNGKALFGNDFLSTVNRLEEVSYPDGKMTRPGAVIRLNAKAFSFNTNIPWYSMSIGSFTLEGFYFQVTPGFDYLEFRYFTIGDTFDNLNSIQLNISIYKVNITTLDIAGCNQDETLMPYSMPSVSNLYACSKKPEFPLAILLGTLIPVSIIVFLLGSFLTLLSIKVVMYLKKRLSLLKVKEKAERSVEKKIIDKAIIFNLDNSYQPLIDSNTRLIDEHSMEREMRVKSFIIPINDLTIEKKLAEGGQGVVYLGTWKNNYVAIKSLKGDSNSDDFENEVSLLASLRHPNILTLFGVSVANDKKYMITEYMEGGSLEKLIYDCKKSSRTVSFLEKLRILQNVASGMDYLHTLTPSIIHRDLKPANILLDNHLKCKIADFGLSTSLSQNNSTLTKNIGTMLYLCPQLMEHSTLNTNNLEKSVRAPKVDVYSFGIIMWELFFEVSPFSISDKVLCSVDLPFISILTKVMKGERPSIPFRSEYELDQWLLVYPVDGGACRSSTVRAIMKYCHVVSLCWHHDLMERPSFSTIIALLAEIKLQFTTEN